MKSDPTLFIKKKNKDVERAVKKVARIYNILRKNPSKENYIYC